MSLYPKLKHLVNGSSNALAAWLARKSFRKCGRNVHFSPLNSDFSYATVEIGNDVYIGPGARFSALMGIKIGDKVTFGPGVTIMGGNHNINEVGQYIFDVYIKRPGDDLPVTIEDDVWIGANAIILKGVTIGRVAVVGAGAVVTKDVKPYEIVGGNPCRHLKMRFTPEQIERHEALLHKNM